MIGLVVLGSMEECVVESVKAFVNTMIEIFGYDNIVIFDNFKSNKLTKCIKKSRIVKLNIDSIDGWPKIQKYYQKMLLDNSIDRMIVFKPLMIKGFRYDSTRVCSYFENQLRSGRKDYGFTFITTRKVQASYFFMKACAKQCDLVVHYLFDPCEIKFDDVIEFNKFKRVYFLRKTDNEHFANVIEYGVKKLQAGEGVADEDKTIDFVFYCSALTEDRQFIAKHKERLESIKEWNVRIYTKGGKALRQNEYFRLLSSSRYSMIIRSYDENTFSFLRFIEALNVNCLCFIHKSCCLDEFERTYPKMYNIVKKYLLIDRFSMIKQKIDLFGEKKRKSILEQLKSTDEYRNLMNIDYLKNQWRKLLEV